MPIQQWSDEILVVDLSEEPQFSEEILALEEKLDTAKSTQVNHVVINLHRVAHLNSSNLAQLLRIRRLVSEMGGKLRVCGVSDGVWSVFLVTGLEKIFRFSPDVPSALASLQLGPEG